MLTTLTHTQQLKNALETAPEEFQLIIIELFKMRKSQNQLKKNIKNDTNNK